MPREAPLGKRRIGGRRRRNDPFARVVAQLSQIIEGLRAVPVQIDIKVVPVQDEKGSIEKMDAPDSPAHVFKPEVNPG